MTELSTTGEFSVLVFMGVVLLISLYMGLSIALKSVVNFLTRRGVK
jgi:hypothetical protein